MKKELIQLLKGKNAYIQTHDFPDPDALATAFALQEYLKYYGIEATICYEGKLERASAIRMLDNLGIQVKGGQTKGALPEDACVVLVDSQNQNSNVTDIGGQKSACIDHHPVHHECEYAYRDIRKTGACATIVASYFVEDGIIPKPNVAAALAYAIKMDAELIRIPYFSQTSDSSFVYMFPSLNIAFNKKLEKNKEKLDTALDVLDCMISEQGQKLIADGSGVISLNTDVPSMMQNVPGLEEEIKDTSIYIRYSAQKSFDASLEAVHGLLSGKMDEMQAYNAFRSAMNSKDSKEKSTVNFENEYSILLTDTTKSILKKINPKCAIEQIGDTTLSSAWIAAMSNGQQPSAPEDYIEVEK